MKEARVLEAIHVPVVSRSILDELDPNSVKPGGVDGGRAWNRAHHQRRARFVRVPLTLGTAPVGFEYLAKRLNSAIQSPVARQIILHLHSSQTTLSFASFQRLFGKTEIFDLAAAIM